MYVNVLLIIIFTDKYVIYDNILYIVFDEKLYKTFLNHVDKAEFNEKDTEQIFKNYINNNHTIVIQTNDILTLNKRILSLGQKIKLQKLRNQNMTTK